MEFRICLSIEKYENASFSLCEISNEYIHVYCLSKVHFSSNDRKKIDLNNAAICLLLLGLSSVCIRYPKGSHAA